MFEDLKNEKIVVEITNLVDKVEKTQEDIDAYCEFMKGVNFKFNTILNL